MKKLKRVGSLLLLALMTFLMSACVNTSSQPSNEEASSLSEETTVEEVIDEDEVVASVVIRNVGDVLIHDTVWEDARTAEGFDFSHMLSEVKPFLENADITVANLEMPVAGVDYGYSTYPQFNAPHEIIGALKDAGVDLVNNATNHSLDMGSYGAVQSAANIASYDMLYAGSYQSWEDYNDLRIIDANGIKVGFLAYANDGNGLYAADGMEYTHSLIDTELFPKEIELMNEQADVSVVMFHMGEEYSDMPNEWQLFVMQTAREAGANYIMGGHPHLVQPFIRYNDNQAAWFSHGNFLTGQYEEETKIGGIGEVTFNKLANGDVVLDKIRFMPTYNVGLPETSYYKVVPLANAAEYGFYNADAWFERLNQKLNYYTQVEVVDYLD